MLTYGDGLDGVKAESQRRAPKCEQGNDENRERLTALSHKVHMLKADKAVVATATALAVQPLAHAHCVNRDMQNRSKAKFRY